MTIDGTQRIASHKRSRTGLRAEALLSGENRLLEMVATGSPLQEILTTLCRVVEDLSGGCQCGILLVNAAGNRVEHGAGPNLPASYNVAVHGLAVTPTVGPCGLAISSKEQVIVRDVASDTRWSDLWRNLAMTSDMRACWSTPILSSTGKVLGTFALYWREPRSPTPQDHRIIAHMTHVAAVAIERKRAEVGLRRGDAYLAEAQRLSRTGSFGWTVGTGQIIWSAETFCIMGYDPGAKPSLDLVLKRVHPADTLLVLRMIDQARSQKAAFNFEHRLLMPNGEVRHVHVVAHPMTTDDDVEFVGAIMDITERKRAAEALHASENLVRGQAEALKRALDALATESDPDRLVGHILSTITEQFKAHSSSVWRRHEATGMICFELAFEDGRVLSKTDPKFAGLELSLPMEEHRPWTEVFRTGKASLIEDIQMGEPFPLRDRLLPMGIVTLLLVPMFVIGQLEGAIGIRFTRKRTFRDEEIELAKALASQAMLAMQLTALHAQSRQTAVTAERTRVARDIHDTLAQGFTGVIMQLEAAKGATEHGNLAEASHRIERAGELARSSLGEARRSVRALRPRSLRNGKLFLAIDDLLKRMTEGTELNAEFQGEGDEGFISLDFEEGLLRITQEALTNAVKHAHARNFRATLNVAADKIQLRLVDDGRGFDPRAEHDGFGLVGMKERVDRMNGEFTVRSKSGVGTEIFVELKTRPRHDRRTE